MNGFKKEIVSFIKIERFSIVFLLVLGIGIRFYLQFIEWSFNGDELDLGLGIINRDLLDLFSPLPNRQSAPPLYLMLQKLISTVAKPYISLNLISFFASCTSIFLFNRILRRHYSPFLHILLLAVFCFNPFIISNSLTLKQYSVDLMFGLLAVNYFTINRNSYKTFFFFTIFCMLSNTGPFFCLSIAIFNFFHTNFFSISRRLKNMLPYILAPIPYLLFFIWFMQQPGAENMKNYMVGYWSASFMPLDFSIIKWIAIQVKGITIFFFSTYWFAGFPMLIIFFLGIFFLVKNRKKINHNKLIGGIFIYVMTGLVHVLFCALKMYPFSDRLFLYLAPGIYLLMGYGILKLLPIIKKMRFGNTIYYGSHLLIILTIILYFTYLPKKTNDVRALFEFVGSEEGSVAFTTRAERLSSNWLEFCQYDLTGTTRKPYRNDSIASIKNDFLISVQNKKFGHKGKFTTPEPIITELLEQERIFFYHRVGGFAIYKFKP